MADYGVIPYGETLEGTMYLAPTKAVEDLNLCSMDDADDNHSYFSHTGNKWMVIRRGGCGFVRKVLISLYLVIVCSIHGCITSNNRE